MIFSSCTVKAGNCKALIVPRAAPKFAPNRRVPAPPPPRAPRGYAAGPTQSAL